MLPLMRNKGLIHWRWLVFFLASSLLVGCGDGDTGPTGPAGPVGETGPAGPSIPSTITATMSAEFTNATVAQDGALTVSFNIADDRGFGFNALPNDRIRFTVAKLIPAGAKGLGEPSQWQSYINRTELPPQDPANGPGTESAIQATSERDGVLTNNGDGTYSYTYKTNLKNATDPLAVAYDEQLTHRVAFQISGGGFPTLNKTFDWQPSTGKTTDIASRYMVEQGSCNNCHGELALHGGGRVDTDYCVTCHNPGSTDANSGNTVDFKVMVHKIHRGVNLPSVKQGQEYAIWGYRDSKHDYSGTPLPMDIRNCTACHDETISTTPDAANWLDVPTMEACGSCHDHIDFALGAESENGHAGGAMADNSECAVCHGQGRFASTRDKHVGVLEKIDLARTRLVAKPNNISIDQASGDVVVSVLMTLDGTPVAALRDGNDVDTDVGAVLGKYKYGTDNGSLVINWDNGSGYQLNHQEIDFNDCIADGNGLFNCSAAGLLAGITDADTVTTTTVDLFLCINEKNGETSRCDATETQSTRVTQVDVTPSFTYFKGDNSVTSDGYDKIGASQESCQQCHQDNKYHHGATTLVQCKTCHNATRASSRGRPGDLKHHVHRFHAGLDDDALIPVEAGDSDHFPSNIRDCKACHSGNQHDIPLQSNPRASIANRDDPVFISGTALVCAACHVDAPLGAIDPQKPQYMDNSKIPAKHQAIIDHMIQNGAVFGSKDFTSANKVESCSVCHAIGSESGIDSVHKL